MEKIKVGVIFGGMSTEHDVSIVSGTSVVKNLDKNKYEIKQMYISKKGEWYLHNDYIEKIEVGESLKNITPIVDVMQELKKCDVLFPVLHGKYGEDGTIQGLFELLKVPYVGCKVLASSIAMDKVYTKVIFEKANLKQAKYVYIRKNKNQYIYIDKQWNETTDSLTKTCERIEKELSYPMFVKPSNSGSSVGINKAKTKEELEKYIEYASQYDEKIIIEETLKGRELECSVLGNEEVEASGTGEVLAADEFYSYEAKYKNAASKTVIPANIEKRVNEKIKKEAIKAFKAIDGKGMSRVDFFYDEQKDEIYINEINTIPGFTEISMYSKLWEQEGIKYEQLLEKLVKLALETQR